MDAKDGNEGTVLIPKPNPKTIVEAMVAVP
jgi:hypothetical protein